MTAGGRRCETRSRSVAVAGNGDAPTIAHGLAVAAVVAGRGPRARSCRGACPSPRLAPSSRSTSSATSRSSSPAAHPARRVRPGLLGRAGAHGDRPGPARRPGAAGHPPAGVADGVAELLARAPRTRPSSSACRPAPAGGRLAGVHLRDHQLRHREHGADGHGAAALPAPARARREPVQRALRDELHRRRTGRHPDGAGHAARSRAGRRCARCTTTTRARRTDVWNICEDANASNMSQVRDLGILSGAGASAAQGGLASMPFTVRYTGPPTSQITFRLSASSDLPGGAVRGDAADDRPAAGGHHDHGAGRCRRPVDRPPGQLRRHAHGGRERADQDLGRHAPRPGGPAGSGRGGRRAGRAPAADDDPAPAPVGERSRGAGASWS